MQATHSTETSGNYRVVSFYGRNLVASYRSYAAAAAQLRKLSAEFFIQGPRQAWFYDDVVREVK